jgi:catalase
MFWDFIGMRPESTHQVSFLFSDRGTPDGYRHLNGYGSHAFKNVNAAGEAFYVKYHFKTDQGIGNLSADQAAHKASQDPDYATRDLYNAIANGNFPSWTMYVQVMTYAQARDAPFHPFDLTKIWPHQDFPLHQVGRLVLDQNPTDYFAQIEQLAFAPSHLVPGIEPSPDKMLQARLFSYPDTHRHRLGTNYQSIPVNTPLETVGGVNNYQRDGPMQITANGAGAPNYFPNSFRGAQPTPASAKWHSDSVTGQVERADTGDEDNFSQCGEFFRNVLDAGARERLTDNIAGHICKAQLFIRDRAIRNFAAADKDFGRTIRQKVERILAQKKLENPVTRTVVAGLSPPRLIPQYHSGQTGASSGGRPVCPYGYSSKM